MQQPAQFSSTWTDALAPLNSPRQMTYPYSGTKAVIPLARRRTETVPIAAKKPRRRGLVLTEQGWQKLLQAGVIYNQNGERYTFEALSEKILLDPRTICRIIEREVGVDKRSLTIFFNAFNLLLENDDYARPARVAAASKHQPEDTMLSPVSPSLLFLEFGTAPEELRQIRARIIEDCSRLVQLLGLDHVDQSTLSIKLELQAASQLEFNARRAN